MFICIKKKIYIYAVVSFWPTQYSIFTRSFRFPRRFDVGRNRLQSPRKARLATLRDRASSHFRVDRWTVTLDYRVVAIKLPDTEVTKILRLRRERVRERRKKETRGAGGGRSRHMAPAKTSLKLSSNLRPSTLSEKSDGKRKKKEKRKKETGTIETHLAMELEVRLRPRRDLETAPIN